MLNLASGSAGDISKDHRRQRFYRSGLGPLEAQAMSILWNAPECSVRQVMEVLPTKHAYTTIMTTMERLFRKGLLKRRMLDRKYVYSPRITIAEWHKRAAMEAVARFLATPHTTRELLVSCLREILAQQDPALLARIQTKLTKVPTEGLSSEQRKPEEPPDPEALST